MAAELILCVALCNSDRPVLLGEHAGETNRAQATYCTEISRK